jgi:nucleoside-diphosphate-sugar epimerase
MLTMEINFEASVRLAKLAKIAGVRRFVFASSCSVYGQSDRGALTEECPQNPQTAYARSKVLAEEAIGLLAGQGFTPVFMRNATVYGYSPRLRLDLAVNNLTGSGFTTGEVRLLSDGRAWRPFVHVRDLCSAAAALLEAPEHLVCGQSFNVGRDDENYEIRDVARRVAEALAGCRVTFGEGAGSDNRTYNVSFAKLKAALPDLTLAGSISDAVHEMADRFSVARFDQAAFESRRFTRLKQLQYLRSQGLLDSKLRHPECAVAA